MFDRGSSLYPPAYFSIENGNLNLFFLDQINLENVLGSPEHAALCIKFIKDLIPLDSHQISAASRYKDQSYQVIEIPWISRTCDKVLGNGFLTAFRNLYDTYILSLKKHSCYNGSSGDWKRQRFQREDAPQIALVDSLLVQLNYINNPKLLQLILLFNDDENHETLFCRLISELALQSGFKNITYMCNIITRLPVEFCNLIAAHECFHLTDLLPIPGALPAFTQKLWPQVLEKKMNEIKEPASLESISSIITSSVETERKVRTGFACNIL